MNGQEFRAAFTPQRLGDYAEQCRIVRAAIDIIKRCCFYTKDGKVYDEAVMRMFEEDPGTLLAIHYGYTHGWGNGYDICYRNHVKDKKGKVIKCDAYLDRGIM